MAIVGNFRDNVITLCDKVDEVLNNNDWPTEEGHDREDYACPIRVLTNSIREELE